MKKKNIWIALLSTFAISCTMAGSAMVVNTVSADEPVATETSALGETKFSVSQDESSMLFVTPLACDDEMMGTIYEVGYTFTEAEPEIISAETNTYYTALVMGEKTLTATQLFGAEYAEDTPMIIWEVAFDAAQTYTATAYYKQGTLINGLLYPNYNGEDVPVMGEAKSTVIYNNAQEVENMMADFMNEFPSITVANVKTQQAKVDAIESKLAMMTEAQKANISLMAEYEDVKSSFMIIDELRDGTVAELKAKFTWTGNGYASINNGITAPNVASALKHAEYGDFITIGKGAPALWFKYKSDGVNLDNMTHVTFVMKNGLNAAVSYVTSSSKRVLAENVASGAFVTITMTVEEFKNESVMIRTPDNSADSNASNSFWVSRIVAYRDVNALLADVIAAFPAKIAIENYRAVVSKIAVMDEVLATMSDAQKAKLTNLPTYNELKTSFMVIDELRDGTVAELKAKFTWIGSGYNSINNGITASNVAATLNHATYGHMVTIGKNGNGLGIKYNSDGLNLDGYTHVTFVMKNGFTSAISFVTKNTKRVLAENVASGAFVTITMTVAEFKSEGVVLFQPDNSSETSVQGSFWISAIIAIKDDSIVGEVDAALANFVSEFPAEITLTNYRSAQTKIAAMEATLATLTAAQQSKLTNMDAYNAKKSSFMVIDDLSGMDIASRFKLNAGANGINNGETAPAVAATLNDATYGPCATIGKNVGGLDIKYAATEGLDLSGYNYVLIAVKNNLGVSVKIQNSSTGAVYVESVENGKFAVVKMTVSDFLKSGFSIWVNNQGTIWISSIIAVK